MLAAMEAKAIDGFVLGSPVTNQAVQKDWGKSRSAAFPAKCRSSMD
jgi:hypothetical protein